VNHGSWLEHVTRLLLLLLLLSPQLFEVMTSDIVTGSLCMLCCRFGFDVPVILRSHDDTESVTPTPEKPMVQVTNPFALDLGSGPASVSGELHLHNVEQEHARVVAA